MRSMRAGLSGRPPGSAERVIRYLRPLVRLGRCVRTGIQRAPAATGLELAVDLEREHGVPATYLFTAYPRRPSRYDCVYAPTDRCRFRGESILIADLLRLLDAEGFDVGLHGSYDSAFQPFVLAGERQTLTKATGLRFSSTRQHFLHWDARTTPGLQDEAGLTIDSSLGFNRNLGFRAGTSLPFHFFDLSRDRRLDLLEVPVTIHDGALFRPDCLELDLDLARKTLKTLLDAIADAGGLATLVFHPNNLEEERYLDIFRFTIEYGLARGAWFASLAEVERWWRAREARLGVQ
jgi:peptidoglycan/xylan/chitin deacetylase (PgdA/CDA1 family)